MKKITFKDIDLLKVGNTISLVGSIWSGEGESFITLFPDVKVGELGETKLLLMSDDEWKRFLRQTDLQEVEILKNDNGNLRKVIIRKTARVIDSRTQWRIFKRDNYTCRYDGRSGIPMTLDHLITWEIGGPTIDENLFTVCRRCNKLRGNTPYEEWINSSMYKKISKDLPESIKQKNLNKIKQLDSIRQLAVSNIRNR